MAAWAEKAFYGTCDKYLSKNPDGSLQLDGICLVAGLGGKDHRDGSLAYISVSRWSATMQRASARWCWPTPR